MFDGEINPYYKSQKSMAYLYLSIRVLGHYWHLPADKTFSELGNRAGRNVLDLALTGMGDTGLRFRGLIYYGIFFRCFLS